MFLNQSTQGLKIELKKCPCNPPFQYEFDNHAISYMKSWLHNHWLWGDICSDKKILKRLPCKWIEYRWRAPYQPGYLHFIPICSGIMPENQIYSCLKIDWEYPHTGQWIFEILKGIATTICGINNFVNLVRVSLSSPAFRNMLDFMYYRLFLAVSKMRDFLPNLSTAIKPIQ